MAGAGVSAVVGVLLVLVITRSDLGQSAAGSVFTTTSLFLVSVTVVQLGADVGIVRWLPRHFALGDDHNVNATLRSAFIPVLAVSLTVAVAVAVFAPQIASLFGDSADVISTQLRILAVFLPVAACYNLVLASTRAFMTMRPTVLIDALGRDPVQLALVFLASLLGLGSVGFVTAWAIPYPIAIAAAGAWLFHLRRKAHRRARQSGGRERSVDPGVMSAFWKFTAPRGVATIAQTLLKRSDIILVAALSSTAEAALYAAATRFVVFGQLAVQALQQALAPQMSATLARGERDKAQDIYRTTTAWAMVLAWPVYIVSAILAPWILMIFGPEYTEASTVVTILALAMLVATACGSVDTVLLMAGRSWLSLMNTGIALVVNLSLNFYLIPRIGIVGAAISWAIAIIVRNALPLAMINRMLGMSPFGSAAAWVAASSLLTIGLLPAVLRGAGASFTIVLAATLVGGAAYLVLLWIGRERIRLTAFRAALTRDRGGTRASRVLTAICLVPQTTRRLDVRSRRVPVDPTESQTRDHVDATSPHRRIEPVEPAPTSGSSGHLGATGARESRRLVQGCRQPGIGFLAYGPEQPVDLLLVPRDQCFVDDEGGTTGTERAEGNDVLHTPAGDRPFPWIFQGSQVVLGVLVEMVGQEVGP